MEVDVALRVEDVEVDYGVEEHAAGVALAACGLTDDAPLPVDDGEPFVPRGDAGEETFFVFFY